MIAIAIQNRKLTVGRFAPSPSGRMHLGNLFACLLAWLSTRSVGGQIRLRLEDLDPDRCRQVYSDQIMRDLEWLGLDWDDEPVYQSKRTEAYREALQMLRQRDWIYPCYCSRAERLAASAPNWGDREGIYSGRCRNLTQEVREQLEKIRNPAWRIKVPDRDTSFIDRLYGRIYGNLARDCGDFIVRRSDRVYAYQLAVTVDDAWMDVTEVVRGSDLIPSTFRQNLLQDILGYRRPSYRHIPLLLAASGRRLAKRDRAQDVSVLRERFTAAEVVGQLAVLSGILEEYQPVTPEELLPVFSWDKLPKTEQIVLH